jgi:hypothetical protein
MLCLGIVKTQHSNATENQIKQFTVRMIGRYIFCWFLEEKRALFHIRSLANKLLKAPISIIKPYC